MHELSIAGAIADVARRNARGRRVRRVQVKIGHLRKVTPRTLASNWELVSKGTNLDGSELVLEEIEAKGICRFCGATTRLPGFPLSCRNCGSFDLDVVAGEELLVEALEIEHAPETNRDSKGLAGSNTILRESWPVARRRH